MSRYNFSFNRIASRLILTFITGLIFGVSMFPFLQAARPGEEMLFEQQAAMGNQNMFKMVALWGLFTAIVSLFTFAKKRFRLVSVLLIICWMLSIAGYVFLNLKDIAVDRCLRPEPYVAPKEIDRALDLIVQRLDIVNTNQGWLTGAFNYRNCLNIQYATDVSELDDAEGFLLVDSTDLQNIKIFIHPKYKTYDDLTIATILDHELTHVGQMLEEKVTGSPGSCYRKEAEGFVNQLMFLQYLNPEESRSIYTRFAQDSEANPSFKILADVSPFFENAKVACGKLNLSQDPQKGWKCVTEESVITVEEAIRKSGVYDEQCINH